MLLVSLSDVHELRDVQPGCNLQGLMLSAELGRSRAPEGFHMLVRCASGHRRGWQLTV